LCFYIETAHHFYFIPEKFHSQRYIFGGRVDIENPLSLAVFPFFHNDANIFISESGKHFIQCVPLNGKPPSDSDDRILYKGRRESCPEGLWRSNDTYVILS